MWTSEPNGEGLGLRFPVGEFVTDAAHGQDVPRILFVRFDRAPEAADVDIHRPGLHEGLVPPDTVQELIPAVDAPGMAGEKLEQFEFAGTQFDRSDRPRSPDRP